MGESNIRVKFDNWNLEIQEMKLHNPRTYLCDWRYRDTYASMIITSNSIAAGLRSILNFNIRERTRAYAPTCVTILRCYFDFATDLAFKIEASTWLTQIFRSERGFLMRQNHEGKTCRNEISKISKTSRIGHSEKNKTLTKLLFTLTLPRVNLASETCCVLRCLIADTLVG